MHLYNLLDIQENSDFAYLIGAGHIPYRCWGPPVGTWYRLEPLGNRFLPPNIPFSIFCRNLQLKKGFRSCIEPNTNDISLQHGTCPRLEAQSSADATLQPLFMVERPHQPAPPVPHTRWPHAPIEQLATLYAQEPLAQHMKSQKMHRIYCNSSSYLVCCLRSASAVTAAVFTAAVRHSVWPTCSNSRSCLQRQCSIHLKQF